MKSVSQDELCNNLADVLRRVEQGEQWRVTVDSRPVADLVPIGERRHAFAPRAQLEDLLAHAPLDRGFARDLEGVLSATVDEL